MKIHKIDHIGIVINDLSAAKEFFFDFGFELQGIKIVGKIQNYENIYKLCYVRGPEGIFVELAEQIR
jgi:catechol 2,3-dioxygenase-like lactoylglutathione lyase family enzyme